MRKIFLMGSDPMKYLLFLVVFVVYSIVVDLMGGQSVKWLLSWSHSYFMIEIPLVLYLYYLFNQVLRDGRWRPVLAAVPVLLCYLAYDITFFWYGKVVRLVEILELPELSRVLPYSWLAAGALIFLFPLLLFLSHIDVRRLQRRSITALPLIILVVGVALFPGHFVEAFNEVAQVNPWSDQQNVRDNGRLSMVLYLEAHRRAVNVELAQHRHRADYEKRKHAETERLKAMMDRPRNVHFIVLESFLDPRLFSEVRFSTDPMHPTLSPFYRKEGFSISPVFGGGTAQAEFELLCGVPAFREYSGIEFNNFSSSPAYCLPGLLAKAGYRAIASNAHKPDFFNAIPAYLSLGFSEIYFPEEYAPQRNTYLSAGDVSREKYMFDGRLFDQNHAFLFADRQPHERPVFNYIMASYGHFPHQLDERVRPRLLHMTSGQKDDMLERYANQYYYRTEALARFLKQLIREDPQSLIVVVSDHLPPLSLGTRSYKKLGYLKEQPDPIHTNRLMVIDRGQVKVHDKLHHYDMPALVLDYLTQGQYCREKACGYRMDNPPSREAYHERYVEIMAYATE